MDTVINTIYVKLPPKDSPVRELFAMEDAVKIFKDAASVRKLPTFSQAKKTAAEIFKGGSPGVISGLTYFVLRHDGKVQLVTFGPKGGYQIRWTFAKV